jgi:hypothetical protein
MNEKVCGWHAGQKRRAETWTIGLEQIEPKMEVTRLQMEEWDSNRDDDLTTYYGMFGEIFEKKGHFPMNPCEVLQKHSRWEQLG